MKKYVRIENNSVVECLEYLPEREGDWREAIEIAPPLVAFKQIYGSHYFDISKNPVEIIWPVIDLTFEQRKEMLMHNQINFIQCAIEKEMQKEFLPNSDETNLEILSTLFNKLRLKKIEINLITSDTELDEYVAKHNVKF